MSGELSLHEIVSVWNGRSTNLKIAYEYDFPKQVRVLLIIFRVVSFPSSYINSSVTVVNSL